MGGGKQVGGVGTQIKHPLESLAHADRPGERGTLYLEYRLHLIHDLHRVSAFPVELVDEGDDWGSAQTTHLHQFDGA